MRTVFQADCDQFDNSQTGYYATEDEAIDAFWAENSFTDNERGKVRVYTREVKISEASEDAQFLMDQGSPSPALGLNI